MRSGWTKCATDCRFGFMTTPCDGESPIIWQTVVLFARRDLYYKCNSKILEYSICMHLYLAVISCRCSNNQTAFDHSSVSLFPFHNQFLTTAPSLLSLSFALCPSHQLNPRPRDSIKTPRHETVIFFIAMRKSGTYIHARRAHRLAHRALYSSPISSCHYWTRTKYVFTHKRCRKTYVRGI